MISLPVILTSDIYGTLNQIIGNTPMIKLMKLSSILDADVYVKVLSPLWREYFYIVLKTRMWVEIQPV